MSTIVSTMSVNKGCFMGASQGNIGTKGQRFRPKHPAGRLNPTRARTAGWRGRGLAKRISFVRSPLRRHSRKLSPRWPAAGFLDLIAQPGGEWCQGKAKGPGFGSQSELKAISRPVGEAKPKNRRKRRAETPRAHGIPSALTPRMPNAVARQGLGRAARPSWIPPLRCSAALQGVARARS